MSYPKNILMIGGGHDGQRYPREAPIAEMPMPARIMLGSDADRSTFELERYRLELLASPERSWQVYVLDTLTAGEAMARLLDCYQPDHLKKIQELERQLRDTVQQLRDARQMLEQHFAPRTAELERKSILTDEQQKLVDTIRDRLLAGVKP